MTIESELVGVTAIVVNYNGGGDLAECLAALAIQDGLTEVVVVDNCSTDGSIELALSRYPATRVVHSVANDGFAAAVESGAKAAFNDTILVLNPDVRLYPDCVAALRDALVANDGVAAPVLDLEALGAVEYGCTINSLGMPRGLEEPRPPFFVPGCALATTKPMLARVSGFDTRFFLFAEDLEYCWRVLLAGGEVQVVPGARGWHRGGGSMPGGYARARGWSTSGTRVALRERNTLAAMISCSSTVRLPLVVAGCVCRSMFLAVAAMVLRRPELARGLLVGLAWNARNIRQSLRRRSCLVRTPAGEREALARMSHGWFMLRTLRDHGLPRLTGNPENL